MPENYTAAGQTGKLIVLTVLCAGHANAVPRGSGAATRALPA